MSILAATFTGKRPRILTALEMIFDLFLDLFWVKTHLFEEAIHHVFPAVSSAVTVAMSLMVFSFVLLACI